MKKSLYLCMALVLGLCLMMTACNSTFEKNAYRTLESARVTYSTAMELGADLYVKKHITEEQWTSLVAVGEKVRAGGYLASFAMQEYSKTAQNLGSGSPEAKAMLSEVLKLLRDLVAHSNELVDTFNTLAGTDVKLPALVSFVDLK
jgi:hypothetical protein